MKKVIVKLAAIMCCAVAITTSCGTDNSSTLSTKDIEELIIGKWTLVSFDGDTKNEGVGTGYWYDSNNVFTYVEKEESSTGTYEINGTEVTMTIDSIPWTVKVKKITNSEMIWIGPNTGKDVALKKQ